MLLELWVCSVWLRPALLSMAEIRDQRHIHSEGIRLLHAPHTLLPRLARHLTGQGQRRAWGMGTNPALPGRNSTGQVAGRCWVNGIIFFSHKVTLTLCLNSQNTDRS